MQSRTTNAAPLPPWTIVVPFKGGTAAKSRLGQASGGLAGLGAGLRRRLALAFLRDTVGAMNAVADVGCIVVVSSDPSPTLGLPGVFLVEDPGTGLNAAVASGIEWARARDALSPVAVVTGDLPCLRPRDLAAALKLAREVPLGVVPDGGGSGSTLISALPGAPVSPHFGIDSCRQHRLAGHAVLQVPASSTIRQDVDTSTDLLRALQRGAGVSTEFAAMEGNLWPSLGRGAATGRTFPLPVRSKRPDSSNYSNSSNFEGDLMPNLLVSALAGIPEILPEDDLAKLIGNAAAVAPEGICDGDILVVTSKIVSKAEGRHVNAANREDAITAETVRLVASRKHPGGLTRIVENRQGLVLAAAGVDNSNTPNGTVLLLPENPDASAHRLCVALRARFGVTLGVILSDTLGRPWREGQTDAAIGAAGLRVLEDYRGTRDAHGNLLSASAAAVADEIAGAADLVKGKASGRPVALVRGLGHLVLADLGGSEPHSTARSLVRPAEIDMFRLGSDEAYAQGFADGQAAASLLEPSESKISR